VVCQLVVLRRLDDICSRVADGRQEPGDRQLAVSVGLPGVLQRPLGCSTSRTDISVMGGADG